MHVPLMESTHHMISDKQFDMMKPTAILINTSRGPVVDETAMYNALKAGKIAAAGIDVFEHEPPGESPMLTLDNAVCLPHIAAYTRETMQRMDNTCVEKMCEGLGL